MTAPAADGRGRRDGGTEMKYFLGAVPYPDRLCGYWIIGAFGFGVQVGVLAVAWLLALGKVVCR